MRMLQLVGNWDAFWRQPNLPEQLEAAFHPNRFDDASMQAMLTPAVEAP
jgi:hypothetical protein